ncbi:MAG: DUF2895 family protein [Candidatus Competibacteraceae bacterium]|nr:DUF2895 family protein [Candidatus Competibacteraceae bacterium]
MATPHGKYQQLEQDIRYRNRIIILLGGLLILLALAYWRLPTLWKVYIPPDLSRPQTVAPGQIPPSYVYAFAKIVMETLNFCPEDCAKDYAANLETLRAYLTPSCFQELAMHRERNVSLYQHRTRKLLPVGEEIFDPQKVTRLDKNVWEVRVEYLLEEHVVGVETRRNRYYYPLRIVHLSLPVELNAYQLAFDCYLGAGPRPVDGPPS